MAKLKSTQVYGDLNVTGEAKVNGNKVFHDGNKPSKGDVGLSNVDNTSDSNKPISTATQTALNTKAASSHTHTWSQVTGQPATATRWPTFGEVSGKPSSYATTWASVASKPAQATRWPTWGEVSSKPDEATRWPTWGEVSSKPSSFTPSAHTHSWSQVTGQPATATRWPTFTEVTGKPIVQTTGTSTTNIMSQKAVTDSLTTKASSSHTHAVSQVTGLQTALDGKAASSHTHAYLPVGGKAADADKLDGLDLHTGVNNQANKVVRTDASGYLNTGWINTTSGNTTSAITDIYVNTNNDGYIRKATKAHFANQMSGYFAPLAHTHNYAATNHTHTAAQIGTATAGLSVGAVGSYALLYYVPDQQQFAQGAVKAGSLLRYASTYSGDRNDMGGGPNAPSGTWRAMGHSGAYNYTSGVLRNVRTTLWLRIS